jgi:N-acetylmuramoyl-L-alanine amidase
MLAKINGISDPNLINVGQVIKLVGATAQPVQQTQRTYTVKSGDTLWSISSEFLGDGSRYVELMHTNGMSSTTIYPGDVLKLPN